MIQIVSAVQSERTLLPADPGLLPRLLTGDTPVTGGWQEVEAPGLIGGMPCGDVILCHARDVYYLPKVGLLLRADGQVLQSSLMAIPGGLAFLDRLPGMQGGRFVPPARMTRRARGAVWMSFGAARNYGHFLFDGLTGLNWLRQAGVLAQYPAIGPRLRVWHRDLVAAVGAGVTELADDVVELDEVVFTSCLNHYLHRSGRLLNELAAHFAAPTGQQMLYVSRRGFSGRILLNEADLEARLTLAGVRVLRPERMSVAAQITAVQGARMLIGPSGAALANLCFLQRGGVVVEIRPAPVDEPWLGLASANLGLKHRVVWASGSLPTVPLWARVRQAPRALLGKYHYAYEVDIPSVLAACGLP